MGFRGDFGGSRAARADGTDFLAWNSRSKQLARKERDLAAHTPRPWERRMLETG